MRTLIIIGIVFVMVLQGTAQNLDCCKSVSEIKMVLEGDWLLKKDSRNKIYRFHFQQNEGRVEVLGELNLPPKAEYTVLKDVNEISESKVNISFKNDGYYIEFIYPFGSVTERIRILTENRLVYGSGKSEHILIRDAR